jgi:hypothetical protein
LLKSAHRRSIRRPYPRHPSPRKGYHWPDGSQAWLCVKT